MRKLLMILVLALSGGCAVDRPWVGDEERVAGQDVAEQVVWREVYGRTEALPTVLWRRGETCGATATWSHPGWSKDGRCVTGEMFDDWHAEVAIGAAGIARTSYSHELCHAVRLLDTGDSDPGHTGGCFVDGRDFEAADRLAAALSQ